MDKELKSSRFLHYGSLVNIKTNENLYLYSQGFIDNTPYLQDLTDKNINFEGAVFRVIPQCIYSTQKEILRYITLISGSLQVDKLDRLEEALDGEIKTNTHTYSNFKGQAIKFGSLVQLVHLQSHRFLTLHSQQSAESERENLRLVLDDFGSEYSHFRIEPSYKYQKQGSGYVRIKDKVHFEITIPELNRVAYLHMSRGPLIMPPMVWMMPGEVKNEKMNVQEVNVSLDQKTRWGISLYAPFVQDTSVILACGDYVWLSRSEEEVCLSATYHEWEEKRSKMAFNDNLSDTNGL